MENRRLCESDYRFMDVLWESEPVPSMKLAELCREKLGWKKSTTYTMLRKLCEKGLAKNENAVVTSLVSRAEVQGRESERFVEQTFDGSLPAFLVAFGSRKKLSAEEVEELKGIIDSMRG
ncbi:MAG: BlaI/MecI/CopY family transcriptional regulator [Oscillospiraceae bacterium]